MEVGAIYSHLNGLEWLQVHRQAHLDEIYDAIDEVDAELYRKKVSKEKTMAGEIKFAPKLFNNAFKENFLAKGWEQPGRHNLMYTDDARVLRRTFNLPYAEQKAEIEKLGKTPVHSYEEIDFLKDRIAIEVQFGKYFSIAWDIFVRHLSYYNRELIDVGVEILPMKSMQDEMSSGPGYYEQAMGALARHGRGTPALPLVVIGIVP